MIIKNHYSHKKTSCSVALGIFYDEKIIGCLTYGHPIGRNAIKSICSSLENNQVFELTRLWIADGYGNNIESWFIGQSFKFIKENHPNIKCLLSYADPNVGHSGSIYQATNWLYQRSETWKTNFIEIDGIMIHPKTCNDRYGTHSVEKLKQITGKDVKTIKVKMKNRYIYFICDKKEKRGYLKELKYPIMPYPKVVENEKK
jgi:hypothetical protein